MLIYSNREENNETIPARFKGLLLIEQLSQVRLDLMTTMQSFMRWLAVSCETIAPLKFRDYHQIKYCSSLNLEVIPFIDMNY